MSIDATMIVVINKVATAIMVAAMIVPEFEEALPPLMPTTVTQYYIIGQ